MQLELQPESTITVQSTIESFPRLFEEQVNRTPDAIAIEFEGRCVTYAELNARCNQLADYLLKSSFGHEARIGICVDRSIEAIECMLGILKAGLAFVPLDPEFPKDRLAYIVEHAGIEFIFADDKNCELFDASSALQIVSPNEVARDCERSNPNVAIEPDLLAYVMYTSGSTGKPKGVQIEHASLTTYCLADVEVYRLKSTDRTLQFSTLNFDIAIEEIYPPLLVGSTVVIRPRERSNAPIELSHLIEEHSITALHIATAYWNEWVNLMSTAQARVPSSLRLVIVTGEKISVEHYRRWKSMCDRELLWCNAYGPTETTVTCTVFIPSDDWNGDQMPIGRPLPGYEAHILNDQMRPVGPHETGHLFIGGPALARGYLDRPDLTEKAFVEVKLPGDAHNRRIYRTGDLARWLDNGEIEFSGRVDHQMKIGSYRIEPGEIESVLNLHRDVLESLIVCEEHGGQKYLIAHVVRKPGAQIEPIDLANFLRQSLPAYMVPSRYSILDATPKTINGKIDRVALPKGEQLQVCSLSSEPEQPTTPLEQRLVDVWKQVLQLPRIGIHDDFFQLGGSSLLVTRVIAMVSAELQLSIPVRDFFANPTIASLALHVEHLKNGSQPDLRLVGEMSQRFRSNLPKIQSMDVESRGCQLAVVHYASVSKEKRRRHAVLIAQPIAHEYARGHRNCQQLAIQLSQQGFDVVRFDYAGTGDSQGDSELYSLDQWQNDIREVANVILSQCDVDKLSAIGVRLGANLLAACESIKLQHLIAWDPIESGRDYVKSLQVMHQTELKSLTRYLSVRQCDRDELFGYKWPEKFQTEIASIKWYDAIDRSDAAATNCWWLQSTEELTSGDSSWGQRNSNDATCTNTWRQRTVSDEIHWVSLPHLNGAFTSFNVSKAVLEILTAGENA